METVVGPDESVDDRLQPATWNEEEEPEEDGLTHHRGCRRGADGGAGSCDRRGRTDRRRRARDGMVT
jgi:hypothetical protein